ncbi:PRC-barrel domain-containing protein [Nonomuraea salmonea]|uniref:PRC-barrel domain-containing protein n=1 Tax=Nonomuraea salmonea TaxID=46181 RepID=UPI0031E5B6B1
MNTEIRNLLDCHVVGSDGQSIGKVGQVYLNDRTGEPEWVTVRTGFFGMKQTFVPLQDARRSGEEIRVPFDKEMIKGGAEHRRGRPPVPRRGDRPLPLLRHAADGRPAPAAGRLRRQR